MCEEIFEQFVLLCSGYIIGSCVIVISLVVVCLLLGGMISDVVQIVLFKGQQVLMCLEFCCVWENGVEVGIFKDVGDDFDVIYGVLVFVWVCLSVEFGVCFYVGFGVGMVICLGLILVVGELVINLVL